MVLKRLSAVQELCLQQQAEKGYAYLCFCVGRELSPKEKQDFWAIANNAALVSLSASENGKNCFSSVVDVLKRCSLEEIASRAMEYEQENMTRNLREETGESN